MPAIEDLFDLHTARSTAFGTHSPGGVRFVTNGLRDSGVLGFVTPDPKDAVFNVAAITLSSFSEATVQAPPFIARGNGGSGLIVLIPKTPLTTSQLAFLAGYINTAVRWRFSWYRQATVGRVRRVRLPAPTNSSVEFSVGSFIPDIVRPTCPDVKLRFKSFAIDALYDLSAGDYHNASSLPAGTTPLVSCGDAENGITSFVTVPTENTYSHRLTIAFNGMNTLTAKYHPYLFAAKDDVAVCTPKSEMRPSTQLFIQLMLGRERWRYSYYRKCFIGKLRRFEVALPAHRGKLDQDAMQTIVESAPYWRVVRGAMTG